MHIYAIKQTLPFGTKMIAMLVMICSCLAVGYCWLSYSRRRNLPPGPWGLPIVGSIPFMDRQLHLYLTKLRERFGETFSITIGNKFFVVLSNYATVKKVLSDELTTGREEGAIETELLVHKGQVHGLIFSQDQLWKEHRRFALSTLRDFGMGKSWLEDVVLVEVEDLCNQIIKQNSQPFDPKKVVSCSVANVICSLIFGRRFPLDDKRFAEFCVVTNQNIQDLEDVFLVNLVPCLRYLPLPMNKLVDKVFDNQRKILNFLEEMVNEYETNGLTGTTDTNYIRAYKIEAEKRKASPNSTFSRFQLISSLHDLFAAGSETTSTTLLWSLLLMLENPNVLKKVRNEIAAHLSADRLVRMEDRVNLPYTEAVLMEIQRVCSLVSVNAPHATLADMQIDGYNVPKGSLIMANNYFIHRDPRYWKDPERFDPSRFLDSDGKVFRPEAFVPFSIGKRSCLGESLAKMELWLFFTNLVHRFDFRLPDGESPTRECKFAIVLSPQPYKVIFSSLLLKDSCTEDPVKPPKE